MASKQYGFDKKVTTAVLAVFGVASGAFTGLVAAIGAAGVVGAIIAKVLTWPVFLTVNGIAYVITFFAIRKRQTRPAFDSRVLVTVFLVGVLIGIILGNLLTRTGAHH